MEDMWPSVPTCQAVSQRAEQWKRALENINEAIIGCLKSRLKIEGEKLSFRPSARSSISP